MVIYNEERIKNTISWYKENKDNYREFSNLILSKILNALSERKIIIAYSSSREKSLSGFEEKCMRTIYDETKSTYIPKYSDPKNQITDLAGVRIVTYLNSDIYMVSNVVESMFEIDYANSGNKLYSLDENKVGYLSLHYIVSLKTPSYEERKFRDFKCEIQIRTVLQDAWAQIFHDRYYKNNIDVLELSNALKRKTNLIAGSLELIDDQIDELVHQYDANSTLPITDEQLQQLLDSSIEVSTLQKYCKWRFNDIANRYYNSKRTINLIKKFGLETIRDIHKLIQDSFVTLVNGLNQTTIDKIIEYVLIISNYSRYFSVDGETKIRSITLESLTFLNNFIDMDHICKTYDIDILT